MTEPARENPMTADTPGQPTLREALDTMVDEVREGTRTLSDAYRDDPDGAKRWRAAVDRIQLAVAAFANTLALASPEPAPSGRLFRAVREVIREGIDAPGVHEELHLAFYEARDAEPAPSDAETVIAEWLTERDRQLSLICGVIWPGGPNGEPLACGYPPNPPGKPMHEHSWSWVPTPGSPEPAPSVERLLDAVRAYGDARADVAYGRATRKAIDLAWDRVLSAGHIPPLGVRSEPAPSGLDAAARVVADIAVGVCNDWMGDPDHGFVLDPLALPVDAYILARLAARDAALRASTPGDEEP